MADPATSASGVREVPQDRAEVWRALAVLEPYCAVCDVSYVIAGAGGPPSSRPGAHTNVVPTRGGPAPGMT